MGSPTWKLAALGTGRTVVDSRPRSVQHHLDAWLKGAVRNMTDMYWQGSQVKPGSPEWIGGTFPRPAQLSTSLKRGRQSG